MKGNVLVPFVVFFIIIPSCNCTILAAAGYAASSPGMRNFLISSGISSIIRRKADALYDVSGFRYAGDQGTGIRKADMEDYEIVEIMPENSESSFEKRMLEEEPHEKNYTEIENRSYSEKLFGVLDQMNRNDCISRLLCEIGADPKSFGFIGYKINHYIRSVPPVTYDSATFIYRESFQAGLQDGKKVCTESYSACNHNLKRIMKFLWFFMHPLR